MQQFRAWIRSTSGLVVVSLLVLGVIFLIVSSVKGLAGPAADAAPPPEETDDLGLFATTTGEEQTPAPERGPEVTTTPERVLVYVSGAVRRPDVYELPAAARVKDAVLAAGGFAEDADPNQINLAGHIADAQQIIVPRQGETPDSSATAPADDPAADTKTLLNINTASASDLESLDGIGQALARRIVEYRAANGPFQSVEELQKVKGISATLIAKLAPQLTIDP